MACAGAEIYSVLFFVGVDLGAGTGLAPRIRFKT